MSSGRTGARVTGRPVASRMAASMAALDMPEVVAALVEEPEPGAPFGAKGVGEPPTISSSAAILAAIRDATGRPVTRAPVRPQDIALGP